MKKRKIIYLICYLAYSSIYIARTNLTMANPSLVEAGILNTVQIGMLGGVFSAMFALGRLINGMLSDKAPPYAMISLGLGICALSNILVGFFPPFIGIFLLWSANAYAQSMLWGSMISVMSDIYDERTAKKRTALLSTSVATGNIISILFCTWLITRFGTRYAFIVPGLITLVLGVAVLATFRDVKPCASDKKHLSFFQLLAKRELQIISIPSFFHGILKENISLWMTVYIIDTYAIDLNTSAYYLLLIPAFGFIGRVAHQIFYRFCNENEHTVSLIGFALCTIFSLLLGIVRINALFSILCLTATYAAASLINTSLLSVYPHSYRCEGNVSSVGGVIDFVTYLGAALGAVVYGVIIKNFGYNAMFISWTAVSVIGAVVISKFIKRGKDDEKVSSPQ